ncbi:SDR family NAD(P)-dependent oxidoreductase [Faecalibacter rhinopitheci]|uniref:SDR family NAD(P)-dependent oxidoreductase n=1 Tax=Faecalibacter rhinopitheci TaxID=2779678 RepID=A0A8J7G5Y8_9FLAO|nr:SDR family NAD(P)-dependent oxidoreductase [Faecalibacter rhinopitheci]MBF0596555.1 SDR family NAD(P)-dependent oxidoreductase [Faecalibacter rhinopitheci]
MQSKVIVITGSSSGVGLTLANYFHDKGHQVYGLSRSKKGQEKFMHIATDVSDKENVERTFQQILAETNNRIDVLINNAGIGMLGAVEDASKNDIEKLLNVNVYGPIYTMQEVLPVMRAQKYGHILNVSSIASNNGLPFRGYYSASKAMIDRLIESARLENRHTGVEITTLNFGDIKTNIAEGRVKTFVSSFYKKKYDEMVADIDHEVAQGTPTEDLIPIIEGIMNQKNTKPHYYIGKTMQKFSVTLKSILPQKVFENIIAKYSKLD